MKNLGGFLRQTRVVRMMAFDVFAGAGGLAVGIEAAGFQNVNLYEKNKVACDTLRHNVEPPTPSLRGQIHEADVSNVDWRLFAGKTPLLAAGPPCPPLTFTTKPKPPY